MKIVKLMQYKLFLLFVYIVKVTPDRFLSSIISILTFIIWNLDFFRKKVVLKNLELAFEELSYQERIIIAKEVYNNYIIYFSDMIKTIDMTKEELNKKVKIVGLDNLIKSLKNEPIIFMTAHFGNWELVPKVIGANFTSMVVLMRNFENHDISNIFKKSRNSFNISTINKDNSAKEIIKAFKENKALGILIDQHSSSLKAVDVKFFNKKVKFNRGVSVLAKKFNATVIPMFSYRKDGKYCIEFLEPNRFKDIDSIDSFTQWQASTIEQMIRKYPSEYYWFHKRFKNIEGSYSN